MTCLQKWLALPPIPEPDDDKSEHKRQLAKARGKRYREKDPERYKALKKAQRERSKEALRQRKKRYYDANRKKCLAWSAEWRAKNQDKIKGYRNKYKKAASAA